MIIGNFNENLTTNLILKNSTILDSKTFEPIILKGGYDYEDCCCDDTCSCGGGHYRIELSDKMTTIELEKEKSSFGWNNDSNKSGPKFLDVPLAWGLYISRRSQSFFWRYCRFT